MIEQKELDLQMRLAAIEMLLAKVAAVQWAMLSDEQFEAVKASWASGLENETFPTLGPALSDAAADQYRQEVLRLLDAVAYVRKSGR